jgi:hypothetical protein
MSEIHAVRSSTHLWCGKARDPKWHALHPNLTAPSLCDPDETVAGNQVTCRMCISGMTWVRPPVPVAAVPEAPPPAAPELQPASRKEFPHQCPRCKGPAYQGFAAIECMNRCT